MTPTAREIVANTRQSGREGGRGPLRYAALPEDLPAIKPLGFVWFRARLNKVAFRNRQNWKVVTFSEMGV